MSLKRGADHPSRTVVPTQWLRLACRSGHKGKRGLLALALLTEAQWSTGTRTWGPYVVQLQRGQALVSAKRLAEDLDVGRDTVRRWLGQICSEMNWKVECLLREDPRVTVPGVQSKQASNPKNNPTGNPHGNPSSRVGTLVSIRDFDALTRFPDRKSTSRAGNATGRLAARRKSESASTAYVDPAHPGKSHADLQEDRTPSSVLKVLSGRGAGRDAIATRGVYHEPDKDAELARFLDEENARCSKRATTGESHD